MSTETSTPKPQPVPPARPVQINFGPNGRESLKVYEREIATYRRELPRLLEEGHAWRHALVKGDEILSIWDTQGDAIQAGCERFGLEPIFVKTIDPRDPERYALLDAYLQAEKDNPCPS
jgi:hypothetical protein